MLAHFVTHARQLLDLLAAGMLLVACTSVLSMHATAAERIEVGFLAADNEESEFWGGMARLAAAVAEDLNVDLRIVHPRHDKFENDGMALVNALGEGAYFMTYFLDERSHRMLQAAEGRNVRTMLINSEVPEKHREHLGAPRQKLSRWIGHMRPDDVQAGYQIAGLLIEHFEPADAIRMIAINGHNHLKADADRRKGLQQRVAESQRATLYDTKEAEWRENTAREVATELLNKYPETNAVWAASDLMALGVLAAVKDMGKRPGKDVVVAGVDWTSRGLAAIHAGDMVGSVGGHFTEAAFALVLIYDYHHGYDFADELGASFKTPMVPMSKEDAGRYLEKVGSSPNPDWSRIDFRRFTKTHNSGLKRYDFSWERIIEAL
jgi:ABC-type sugar transport system substrate-binding protein